MQLIRHTLDSDQVDLGGSPPTFPNHLQPPTPPNIHTLGGVQIPGGGRGFCSNVKLVDEDVGEKGSTDRRFWKGTYRGCLFFAGAWLPLPSVGFPKRWSAKAWATTVVTSRLRSDPFSSMLRLAIVLNNYANRGNNGLHLSGNPMATNGNTKCFTKWLW